MAEGVLVPHPPQEKRKDIEIPIQSIKICPTHRFETLTTALYTRAWISRASGWQTERADCNYVFEKITFLENSFNKGKSVVL